MRLPVVIHSYPVVHHVVRFGFPNPVRNQLVQIHSIQNVTILHRYQLVHIKQVSATWQGNPIYNTRAPTDPSLFIWYDCTIIGWDGVSGNYSVRFHEDNLVDEHVLPKHVRYKGAVIGTGGKAAENEWLTYQSLRDPNESKPDSNSPDAPGMKKKIKKSAVDFAPAVSDMTARAIVVLLDSTYHVYDVIAVQRRRVVYFMHRSCVLVEVNRRRYIFDTQYGSYIISWIVCKKLSIIARNRILLKRKYYRLHRRQ